MSGAVIVPTFKGHADEAISLIKSIRQNSNQKIKIIIVLSYEDEKFFIAAAEEYDCEIKFIEKLLENYCQVKIDANDLIKSIGKFRYQALKKIFGILSAQTELAVVIDSESNVVSDLKIIFDGGLENTTVLYSKRSWGKIPHSLSHEVRNEVNTLLDSQCDFWFFESFNWLYSTELLKGMISSIERKMGKNWVFRPAPLFECQLYYQFVFTSKSKYHFLPIEELLSNHFGADKTKKLLDRFYSSSYSACGILEYAGQLLTREEYKSLITNESVIKHLRFVRHEPLFTYNIVEDIKNNAPRDFYIGEAAMHRSTFIKGRIALLISGQFNSTDDILNLANFIATVECDVFVSTNKDNFYLTQIKEILNPITINEIDENVMQGDAAALIIGKKNKERDLKPNRDIGTSSMFDKINASYLSMCEHESKNGFKFDTVIRIRPGIFSTKRLRDVFWLISEYAGSINNCILFPNRFWSQGINDQFFLGERDTTGKLLESLTKENYSKAKYLNPENFLAAQVLNLKIKPVAFEFQYLLIRGGYPELDKIDAIWREQEQLFWSQTIRSPAWKNAESYLKKIYKNAQISNNHLTWKRITNKNGKDIEYINGIDQDKNLWVIFSEYKSPHLFAFCLKSKYSGIVPYLMHFEKFMGRKIENEVRLISANEKSNIVIIEISGKEYAITLQEPYISNLARFFIASNRAIFWKIKKMLKLA